MFNRCACKFRLGLALASLAALAACGGSGATAPSSTLNVGLTDAPTSLAGVQSVFITVTGVDVQPTNGPSMTFSLNSPLTMDLLTLRQLS
jgi:hypothetical protein